MNFNNIIIDLRIEDFVKRKTLILLSFQIHILIKLKIQLLLIYINIYTHSFKLYKPFLIFYHPNPNHFL